MLTVVLECQDHEPELAQTLSVLVSGAVEGLVREVVVLDHGARDGTAMIADAAGCHYHTRWNIKEILQAARGNWLLFIEPGAKLQPGWIDSLADHIHSGEGTVRFTESRSHQRPFLQRVFRRTLPLELGLLVRKQDVVASARQGMTLADFVGSKRLRQLPCEIIPARVARAARR